MRSVHGAGRAVLCRRRFPRRGKAAFRLRRGLRRGKLPGFALCRRTPTPRVFRVGKRCAKTHLLLRGMTLGPIALGAATTGNPPSRVAPPS